MQFPLPFPPTEPPFDITPLLDALADAPTRCPFCGSDNVDDFASPDDPDWRIESWICWDCGREFEGDDHIPHPYQATLLYRCPVCGTTGTEPKECPRCARAWVAAAGADTGIEAG